MSDPHSPLGPHHHHPQSQVPPPQFGGPAGAMPAYAAETHHGGTHQPLPPKKSGRGCLIAILVVLGLVLVAVVAMGVGIAWLGNRAMDAIGSVGPCPYISNDEASAAVGTDAEVNLFTGGLGKILNITDPRVLPEKSSCIIQPTSSSSDKESLPGLGRAVKYTGSDATMLYEREIAKAKGTKEDRGGGASVETASYFNREVTGIGDRAFCTKSSGSLAGVLVLDGNTLVYVALTPAGAQPGVDLDDPDNAKLTTDDPACDASTELARKILAKE
jgi:hypothetical protein